MSLPLDFKTVTIPAGSAASPGIVKSQLAGVFFYCKAATSPFQMQFDAGTVFPFDTGFKIKNPDNGGGMFQGVTFYNPTANAILVSFYVGGADVDFVGVSAIKEVSSRAVGGGLQTLEPAATIDVPGISSGSQRKQIIITNLDAAVPLVILDATGAVFGAVFAQTPWSVPTDAFFTIKNNGVAPINFIVGELYYNS